MAVTDFWITNQLQSVTAISFRLRSRAQVWNRRHQRRCGRWGFEDQPLTPVLCKQNCHRHRPSKTNHFQMKSLFWVTLRWKINRMWICLLQNGCEYFLFRQKSFQQSSVVTSLMSPSLGVPMSSPSASPLSWSSSGNARLGRFSFHGHNSQASSNSQLKLLPCCWDWKQREVMTWLSFFRNGRDSRTPSGVAR